MSIIYEPRGKAYEYSPLAANLYKGCTHGCIYCYAPSALFMKKEEFHAEALPRKMVKEQLVKDVKKFKGSEDNVLLCFTSDPYQPIELEHRITRFTIKLLNANNIPVTILTKAGVLPRRDFDLLCQHPKNAFSVTLTTDLIDEFKLWEPNAGTPADRMQTLQLAHLIGIKTWVSFEPVINPGAVLRMIKITHPYTDLYKVGKLNYHIHAKTICWRKFASDVVLALTRLGKPYYLKKDLVEAADRCKCSVCH